MTTDNRHFTTHQCNSAFEIDVTEIKMTFFDFPSCRLHVSLVLHVKHEILCAIRSASKSIPFCFLFHGQKHFSHQINDPIQGLLKPPKKMKGSSLFSTMHLGEHRQLAPSIITSQH
jgi:hypothetical protein